MVFRQCGEEEYKEMLAARGLPPFLQVDMAENMRFVVKYGFFGGVGLEGGHEVWVYSLSSFCFLILCLLFFWVCV